MKRDQQKHDSNLVSSYVLDSGSISCSTQINDKRLRSRILQDAYGTAPRVYILQNTLNFTPNQRNAQVFIQEIVHKNNRATLASQIWKPWEVNFETHFPTIRLQGRHYRADADGILDNSTMSNWHARFTDKYGKNNKMEQDGTSP